MKTSTKFLAAAFLLAAMFINSAKAQTMSPNPWRLGIGLEAGAPTGSPSSYTAGILGATARLQYDVSSRFDITLTSGYYNFFEGNNNNTYTVNGNTTYATNRHDQGMIPVKLGIKAFFTPSLYFGAEGGVGFETKYSENKKLILAPGLGWASDNWDIGMRYENYSGQSNNYGQVALRLAYGFGL